MEANAADVSTKEEYDVAMGSLDVRDAFLQVEQDKPILVELQGESFVIR